jgi:hypothetical protein
MNKKILKKAISFLLAVEGFAHFITPILSFYGMYRMHTWSWLIAISPLFDLFFAITCFLGSYLLGEKHHHHH